MGFYHFFKTHTGLPHIVGFYSFFKTHTGLPHIIGKPFFKTAVVLPHIAEIKTLSMPLKWGIGPSSFSLL